MEKLKVTDSCIGCGYCVGQAEKYFQFTEQGMSTPKQEEVEPEDKATLLEIIEACPGEAIVIEEEKEAA